MAFYNFTREQLEQLGFKLSSTESRGDFMDWFILNCDQIDIWIQMDGTCEMHEFETTREITLPTMTMEKIELLIKSIN